MQFERSGVEFGTNNKMLKNLFKELYRSIYHWKWFIFPKTFEYSDVNNEIEPMC